MIIKKWWWKNFMSYGKVEYDLELDEKGSLILLNGKNGHGKSAALKSLDVAIYGQTLNRKGKRLTKNNYPNRTNGNMEVGAIVTSDNGNEINITRQMNNDKSAMKTKLIFNGVEDKPNKLDEFVENELGMDFDIFKSFCSVNVAHFKDFVDLTPNDKRVILDKLFNMEQINSLNKILKDLKTQNSRNKLSISGKIDAYQENILDLNKSIDEYIENKKSDNVEKINELKKQLPNINDKIEKAKADKKVLDVAIDEFEKGINKLLDKKNNYNNDIKDVKRKINLYSIGNCPTCGHSLSQELKLLPSLELELEKSEELYNKISDKIRVANKELLSYKNKLRDTDNIIRDFNNDIKIINKDIRNLEKVDDKEIDVDVFRNNIEDMKNKVSEKKNEFSEIQKMEYIYEVLAPIWTDEGIKKRIISSLIDPINEFIKSDLEKINFPYKVELDNKFDAKFYDMVTEIDADSLSSGESKVVNLIIMLAYIKMMRMNNNLNLLILDEIFTTVDLEWIDDILHLLNDFSKERKINIFVIHHSELKEHFFDKVLKASKPYFSILE